MSPNVCPNHYRNYELIFALAVLFNFKLQTHLIILFDVQKIRAQELPLSQLPRRSLVLRPQINEVF